MPSEFGADLPSAGAGERFDVDESYRRVAREEGGEYTEQDARQHSRAVVAALKQSLTGPEFGHVAEQLPGDYADLLGTDPVQH